MRYVVITFCVIAAACSGAAPTAPTLATSASSSTPIGSRITGTEAKDGPEVPFAGRLEATETLDGSLHHLTGTGIGSHLGRFTYAADITVDDETGDGFGTVTWTAANGDQIRANTTGRILATDYPNNRITVGETQIVTGGTGRFSGATGTIQIERSLDFVTGYTSGPFTGTIRVGH